jgi:anionic cell wall polymer biosynthesis LytR-Cps2A-Psr (LCP) family protein
MTSRIRRVTGVVVMLALLTTGLAVGVHRTSIRPAYDRDGLLVALVIGSDIGVPYRPGDPLRGRADAIHIVAVDPDEARATVVDIPRDSVIGGTKVNAHLAYGGPDAWSASSRTTRI